MILKIRELREEAEMTQTELASKIKNVQRNISNWENGTSEPDCQSILAIANTFKVPIDVLFGRSITLDGTEPDVDEELKCKLKKLSPEQKNALLCFLDSMID